MPIEDWRYVLKPLKDVHPHDMPLFHPSLKKELVSLGKEKREKRKRKRQEVGITLLETSLPNWHALTDKTYPLIREAITSHRSGHRDKEVER